MKMKRTMQVLNVLLIAAVVLSLPYYMEHGNLTMKGTISGGFVLLGVLNLVYCMMTPGLKRNFPVAMVCGLFFAMLGDILLGRNFVVGAGLFALGHVLYFVAYCMRMRFSRADLLPGFVIFVLAGGFIAFAPMFDFGGAFMLGVCEVYAVIISCMVGKAFTNCLRERSLVNVLLFIGSCMFFFSDLMLVLSWFADAPDITNTLCCYTYWPAQCLLAHAVYHYSKEAL